MSVNEIFKCIQIATLHPGYALGVRVKSQSYIGVTLIGSQKMRFLSLNGLKRTPGRKIRGCAEPHLQGIEEVGEGGHDHGLQHLLFAKSMAAKRIHILAAKFGWSNGEFQGEIQ